jgi:hypothetical protein
MSDGADKLGWGLAGLVLGAVAAYGAMGKLRRPNPEWDPDELELYDSLGDRVVCEDTDPRFEADGMRMYPVDGMPGWFGVFVGDPDEWMPVLARDGFCDADAYVYTIDFDAANRKSPTFYWFPYEPDPYVYDKGATPDSALIVAKIDRIPAEYVRLVKRVPWREIPDPDEAPDWEEQDEYGGQMGPM